LSPGACRRADSRRLALAGIASSTGIHIRDFLTPDSGDRLRIFPAFLTV